MDELFITITLRRRPEMDFDRCELTMNSQPYTHLGGEPTEVLTFQDAMAKIESEIGDAICDHFTVGFLFSDKARGAD